MQLTQLISCLMDSMSPMSTIFMQLTQVKSSPVNEKISWVSCLRTGKKLHFTQLPNKSDPLELLRLQLSEPIGSDSIESVEHVSHLVTAHYLK